MSATAAAIATPPPRLPALREEIGIFRGPAALDGAPTWTLHDPARNRYFRIGWPEFEILSRWEGATLDGLQARLAEETTLAIDREDILNVAKFLTAHDLVRIAGPQATAQLMAKAERGRQSWGRWLLQNYLFMRVPLARPDRLLTALYPYISFVFTRGFLIVVLAAAVTGMYLVGRQWEGFWATLVNLFNVEGAILFGLTLACLKIVHEFGHAFTAKRFGCRVPIMGVAFLVFVPVLFTDVNDAWRLTERRQRLAIGLAGVLAELCCAAFAVCAWSFLPEGSARSVAFLVATTTWVTTLLLNLSPFMRFDGYYVLSDWLETPNLHARAFALARWRLRELIFGFGDPPPEILPAKRRRLLTAFAALTWTYRFVLFMGIAAIVYEFTFKAAGVVLGAIEFGYFVVAPIVGEGVAWWKRRHDMRFRLRTGVALALLGGFVLLLFVPLRSTVEAPAILKSRQRVEIFTPDFGSQVARVAVHPGDLVKQGATLIQLAAPDLVYRLAQARSDIEVLEWQLGAKGADAELLARSLVTEQEYETARANYRSLIDQQSRLEVTAPIAGRVVDVVDGLAPGAWLAPKLRLMSIVDPTQSVVEAYVYESDLFRVRIGDEATYFSDADSREQAELKVAEIARASTQALDEPAMASIHGGPIPVRANEKKTLVPDRTVYRVTLTPIGQELPPVRVLRGTVLLRGERISLAARVWRAVLAVLIRESGF
jgi:putative peptide zinc metalloprotease protein